MNNFENEYAQNLQESRNNTRKPDLETRFPSGASDGEVKKLEALVANKDKVVQFVLMGMLAAGNDMLDFIGIGAIPVIGDIPDIGAGVAISTIALSFSGHPRWKAQAIIWGATFFELVPLAVNDIMPTDILGVIVMYTIIVNAGRKAQEKLESLGIAT